MKNFDEILKELGACIPAKEWAEGKDFKTVWATCHRGDWMGWLVDKIEVDRQLVILVGGYCVNTGKRLMLDKRSIVGVEICIRYGNGEVTEREFEIALQDANDAVEDILASTSAEIVNASENTSYAVWSAMMAALYRATVYAADAGACITTRDENLQQTADIIRQYIPIEMMIEKLETL